MGVGVRRSEVCGPRPRLDRGRQGRGAARRGGLDEYGDGLIRGVRRDVCDEFLVALPMRRFLHH